jgi:hypothetical protein
MARHYRIVQTADGLYMPQVRVMFIWFNVLSHSGCESTLGAHQAIRRIHKPKNKRKKVIETFVLD